jgi:glutamyl-tRNA synthetase
LRFTDLIRGEVSFDTSVVDDKVLLKADGMPTYHLAVVVDDLSHEALLTAFRGEDMAAQVHQCIFLFMEIFYLAIEK